MRIFVLGAGATGSLLAQLLERQGHTVWCGDRDLQRAHHFLGKSSSIAITDVECQEPAWDRAGRARLPTHRQRLCFGLQSDCDARGAAPARPLPGPEFAPHQEPVQSRAVGLQPSALKKRTGSRSSIPAPRRASPTYWSSAPRRCSIVVETVQIRLYESSESDDPISQWSPEGSFDEAISNPRVYRAGKFRMEKALCGVGEIPFSGPGRKRERRFLRRRMKLLPLPHFIPMQGMDVKIGGQRIRPPAPLVQTGKTL